MSKDKKIEAKENEKVTDEKVTADSAEDSSIPANETAGGEPDEIKELKEQLEKKEGETKELLDRMQRLAAEFDNYRKRTQKEKERLYDDAVSDIVGKFLPVVDNLERAVKAAEQEEGQGLKDGIILVFRQISDILDKLDVKPIEAVGKPFDPELHNAVMHIEDDTLEHNCVVEEFQKGYIYKNEYVIRHSMVKVAN